MKIIEGNRQRSITKIKERAMDLRGSISKIVLAGLAAAVLAAGSSIGAVLPKDVEAASDQRAMVGEYAATSSENMAMLAQKEITVAQESPMLSKDPSIWKLLSSTHIWDPQEDVDKYWGGVDNNACWAATASNVLDYTGWNISGHPDAIDIYDDMLDHLYTGTGGTGAPAYEYYVDTYYPHLDWEDYFHQWNDTGTMMQKIDEYLNEGYGIYLSINGHAVTCWGFEKNYAGEYTHIYITDSDDASYEPYGYVANDNVYKVPVSYDSGSNRWELTDYHGSSWRHIVRIDAFEPRPLLIAPIKEPVLAEIEPIIPDPGPLQVISPHLTIENPGMIYQFEG
ncbi:MAG: hypothetical protein SVY53_03175 [Chloroflexota bacterium]|nr:hypothetical protein [Chloroflexota bacterium]